MTDSFQIISPNHTCMRNAKDQIKRNLKPKYRYECEMKDWSQDLKGFTCIMSCHTLLFI